MMKKLLYKLFAFINWLIPKNKNQIIFYSSFGFEDNARAYYEYLVINAKEKFKIVWAFEKEKYSTIPGCISVKYPSFRCMWHYMRSKTIFETHSFFGKNYNNKKQTLIYALHGMPFKGSSVLDKKEKMHQKNMIGVSTSQIFDDSLVELVGIPRDKIYHIGLPRNDYLFKDTDILEKLNINNYNKIILWMPTFRTVKNKYNDGVITQFGIPLIEESDLQSFEDILSKYNCLLIFKLHPWAADNMCDLKKYNHIISLSNIDLKGYSLHSLISKVDAMITDYSSIVIDYLLLDRPICFAFNDLEEYTRTRKLDFSRIDNFKCGYNTKTKEGLISFIELVNKDIDNEKIIRKVTANKCHKYKDGNTCQRLFELIKTFM